MRAATDADDYARRTLGAYLALPRALVFHARRALWGFALWGTPSERDARALVPLLALELAPGVAAHASLVDVRRLEAGDPRAFGVLTRYLRDHFDAFRTRVTRLALVRPAGLLGATVAGFYQVAGAPYPVRVFDELGAATAWLRARSIAGELDATIASASGTPAVIVALRRWLDRHLRDASLPRAARALSRAPRSLQRDLGAAATSFQGELDAARIRLAERLLAETDSPISEIAYDVGCASPQHFATLFRRVTGTTATAVRTSRHLRRWSRRPPSA